METEVEAESLDHALNIFQNAEYQSGSMVKNSNINDELVQIEEAPHLNPGVPLH